MVIPQIVCVIGLSYNIFQGYRIIVIPQFHPRSKSHRTIFSSVTPHSVVNKASWFHLLANAFKYKKKKRKKNPNFVL